MSTESTESTRDDDIFIIKMSAIWWALSQKEVNIWADVRWASVAQPIDGAVSQDSDKAHSKFKKENM